MAKRTGLVLALAGAALCAGVVWFAISPTDAPAQASSVALEVPAQSTSANALTQPTSDPIRTLDVTEANDAQRASVTSTPEFDVHGAIWVEGRVVFPPETPADERAEVLAHYKDYGDDDEQPHRARVAADGTFRAAFPSGTASGWLELRARYSYLYEPLKLTFDEPPGPVVLEPEIGGCIRAEFVLPAGSESRASELIDTKVTAYVVSGLQHSGDSGRIRRFAEVDEPPRVEIGGLVPGRAYHVAGSPNSFPPFKVRAQGVRAGAVTSLQIPLANGVRLSGEVVDEHDQPIAGATFHIAVTTGNEGVYADRKTPTGSDGRFTLNGIRPGRIAMTASATGYLATRVRIESTLDGASHDDLRVVLKRGRSMRGRVAWRDGRPASGASVVIALVWSAESSRQSEELGWDSERKLTVDAEGTFEITGLTQGPFTLIARAPTLNEESSPASVRADKVMSGGEPLVLTLDAGLELRGRVVDDTGAAVPKFTIEAAPASTNVDWENIDDSIRGKVLGGDGRFVVAGLRADNWRITVRGNGGSVSREAVVPVKEPQLDIVLPRPVSISGVVVDPEGNAIRGARVSYGLAPSGRAPNEFLATSKPTGADGRFELAMVSSGPAMLIARHPDWAPGEGEPIDLSPGATRSDVVIGLRASGRVTGEIRDASGRPDPMRQVYASGARGAEGLSIFDQSDAEGLFAFEGLPAGEYWIRTQASLAEQESVRSANGQSDWQALQNFTRRAQAIVVAGETTHVVLGERPRAPVRVVGRVSQNGRGIDGITVSAGRSDSKSASQNTKTARTGESGEYELTLDEPGPYWFRVSRQAVGTSAMRQETIPEQEQIAVDFELPDGRIAGRVISPEGEPVSEFQVQLRSGSSTAIANTPGVLRTSFGYATSDADGRFAFEYLLPGTYSVRAGERVFWGTDQAPRYGPASADDLVLAEHAAIVDLVLKLELAARLEIQVSGPSSEPVSGADVFMFDEAGTRIDDPSGIMTDAAGRKHVGGLPARPLLVFARKGSLASAVVGPERVSAGETESVDIKLRPATLLDIVIEPAGAGMPEQVIVRDEHGIDHAALWSRSAGFKPRPGLVIEGQAVGPLPPGRYRVSPRDSELEKHGVDVVVSGDELQKVKLTLPSLMDQLRREKMK